MPSVLSDQFSSLWNFSLEYYARAGVADACLQLQDTCGVNVNLLLWCIWLERRGVCLDESRLASAQKRIQSWDAHYVIPLRQLRRRMKAEFGVEDNAIEQLRSQIKSAELLAEKQLQIWLEDELQHWKLVEDSCPLIAGANLRLYLQQFNLPEAAIAQHLALLAHA